VISRNNNLIMRLATLPRYPLATLPTPLQRARNLEVALGPRCPRIYLKRDDLTGLTLLPRGAQARIPPS